MSIANVLRRGLAAAAVTATGLAVLAGAGLPAAQAAPASPASPAARPASLHTTGPSVALGALGTTFNYDFSEAPNGSVYYSSGSTVYVVHGTSAPVVVLHASGHVFAVAANRTELFVDVGRKVTGYKLSNGVAGAALRHWTLYTTLKTTSVGLYVVGSNVWAWTDWATDESGFEYADVSRFKTSSGTVHKISNNAYPADMAANSSGLYFQQAIGLGRLTHVTPSGSVLRVRDINLDGPLALAGGRVELLAFHRNSHAYLDSYGAATLARKFSKRVSTNDIDIASTGAGLLMLSLSGKISQLNTANGATRSSVVVTDAATLVPGPSAAVLVVTGGNYFLVRLAS
jgi:hypothetical protein